MAQPILTDIRPLQPTALRRNSQSPSRSPRRHDSAPAPADRPLRGISPSSAYRVIVSSSGNEGEVRAEDEEGLMQSVEKASAMEREFGVKVAKSAMALKGWCEEIQGWEWSGAFEVRDEEDEKLESEIRVEFGEERVEEQNGAHEARDGERGSAEGPLRKVKTERIAREGYVGSMTAEQASTYERRLEEIADHLEDLDMEEQKAHVLKTHLQQRSPRSAGKPVHMQSVTEYVRLDGLTAIVTETILQALPHYNLLTLLLEAWTARIIVLKQIPAFYMELENAQQALNSAWIAIGFRLDKSAGLRRPRTIKLGNHGMFRHSFEQIHTGLEEKMAILGKSIDTMLDVLEAREDTLPDAWIDTVEELELDYSSWTVEAQKKVLLYEHRLDVHTPSTASPTTPKSSGTWSGGSKQLLANAANAATFAITGRTISMPAFRKEAGEVIEEENASEENSESKHSKDPFVDSQRNKVTSSSFGLTRGLSTQAEPVSLGDMENRPSASEASSIVTDHFGLSQDGGETFAPLKALASPMESYVPGSNDQLQLGLGISGMSPSTDTTSSADSSSSDPGPSQKTEPVPAKTFQPTSSLQSPKVSPSRPNIPRDLGLWRDTNDKLARELENLLMTLPTHTNFKASDQSHQYRPPTLSKLDGDSSTRLLELHLPGRQTPLRLFVRLLGEHGDRVMVRVGGGWADLGEYLRSYAAHHSRAFAPNPRHPEGWYSPTASPTKTPTTPTLPNSPTRPSFAPRTSPVRPVRPIRSMSSSFDRTLSPRPTAEEGFRASSRGPLGSPVVDRDLWGEEI